MPALQELITKFPGLRVLVFGDLMLDQYVYGHVSRISPEGPIPILVIDRETMMPGGAANVARNITALGGRVAVVGMIGPDMAGQRLQELFAANSCTKPDLFVAAGHCTIQKTRFVAQNQQLLRVDTDGDWPSAEEAEVLLSLFSKNLPDADIVVLSDYGKGVLSETVLRGAIAAARAAGKPIIADPKSPDIARYDGVTLITPNTSEASAASGVKVWDDASAENAATALLTRAPAIRAILITRGGHGMSLLQRGSAAIHAPTIAREVFDVSGAGDTVVATYALCLAAGADMVTAMRIANLAAGLSVEKFGTATVTPDELSVADQASRVQSAEAKIMPLQHLLDQIQHWRARGERIGFTNGCFDLMHPGHVALLACAKSECNRLIVGVNSDASVKRLKGPSRPLQDEVARTIVLAALKYTDAVTLYEANTPIDLICAIRPDVLIKGADYTLDQVVGADVVQSYGGRVVLAELAPDHSTTRTIARLASKNLESKVLDSGQTIQSQGTIYEATARRARHAAERLG